MDGSKQGEFRIPDGARTGALARVMTEGFRAWR
jgi:hypothetical protein